MRVRDYFARGVSIAPERAAFRSETGSYSYAEAARWSARIANALATRGADEDTPIAILTPNDIRSLICLVAIHQVGARYVRLNFRSAVAETVHILGASKAQWLFFHSDALSQLDQIRQVVGTIEHFVCIDTAAADYPSLEDLARGQSETPPPLANARDHVAMLASTGGTTGLPKLVMLTDQNFETMVAAQLASMPHGGAPTLLIATAMTHAASSLMHAVLAQGGTVDVRREFDPADVLATIARNRVTHIYLPPTAIYMLLDAPQLAHADLSSLAYLMYGSAPIAIERLKQAMRCFGDVMVQFYGQAECPMFISVMSPEDHRAAGAAGMAERLASCGRPTPFCSVAILDDEGNQLAKGGIGEIAVAGNLVMRGYLSTAADPNFEPRGWLRTGDIGRIDDGGFLHIVDRKKDMIISGGFNIYPAEIEQVLWSHPAIYECAVIGVPSEKWGEEVRAVVCLRPGSMVPAEELIDFCRSALGSIKAPKAIEFTDGLPKSAAGKILKRELRDRYWTGVTRRI